MQALVSEIATQPELARIYWEQVVEPRREQLLFMSLRGSRLRGSIHGRGR
jgi:hypothetical protein